MEEALSQIEQAESFKQQGNTRFKEQNFRGALGAESFEHRVLFLPLGFYWKESFSGCGSKKYFYSILWLG